MLQTIVSVNFVVCKFEAKKINKNKKQKKNVTVMKDYKRRSELYRYRNHSLKTISVQESPTREVMYTYIDIPGRLSFFIEQTFELLSYDVRIDRLHLRKVP